MYDSAALVILIDTTTPSDLPPLKAFVNSRVPGGILDGPDLPDVFDLYGVHDFHIVPETVQVVYRFVFIPSEGVALRGIRQLLHILRG